MRHNDLGGRRGHGADEWGRGGEGKKEGRERTGRDNEVREGR